MSVITSVETLAIDVSGSVTISCTTILLIGVVTLISTFPGGEITGASFMLMTVINTEALLEIVGLVPSRDAVTIIVYSVTEDSASSEELVEIVPVISSITK